MVPKIRNENSDSPKNRGRQQGRTENPVGMRLLEALGERDVRWLSEATHIAPSTLHDYVKRGIANADNAITISKALHVSLDWLLKGDRSGSSEPPSEGDDDTVRVPVLDMAFSAGPGVFDRGAAHFMDMSFPRDWVVRSFGRPDGLRMVRVEGDSQEPDISDGDWIMIDTNRTELRDGLSAVVLDDTLLVKRIQLQGRTIRLISANPLYEPIVVDRQDEDRHFRVLGRVVWSSKVHVH
jgi:phage repressor protein C with HTH and peptisase S24 domain